MILYDRNRWLNAVFSWRGTALRTAKWRVVAMMAYALAIQVVYEASVSLGGSPFKKLSGSTPASMPSWGRCWGS